MHWLSYLAVDSLTCLSNAMFTFLLFFLFTFIYTRVTDLCFHFVLLRFMTNVYMLCNMNKFLKREIVSFYGADVSN